jgi:hypothetical protein
VRTDILRILWAAPHSKVLTLHSALLEKLHQSAGQLDGSLQCWEQPTTGPCSDRQESTMQVHKKYYQMSTKVIRKPGRTFSRKSKVGYRGPSVDKHCPIRLKGWSVEMAVVWVVVSGRLVRVYRRFRGAYCLHHHSDECKLPPVHTALQPLPLILKPVLNFHPRTLRLSATSSLGVSSATSHAEHLALSAASLPLPVFWTSFICRTANTSGLGPEGRDRSTSDALFRWNAGKFNLFHTTRAAW